MYWLRDGVGPTGYVLAEGWCRPYWQCIGCGMVYAILAMYWLRDGVGPTGNVLAEGWRRPYWQCIG